METTFKFLFGLAVFLFSLISIGVFLLIVKIILMFSPQIQLLGLTIY
ncbi:MAG: hypothetical protein PHG95_02275 [Patescibacteria group bacterium]|nr:hypothetical protein [Patescibacteria group bacterium]